ncbi:MAG: helix-turn-helix domain-containing protein [Solirubrobacteraceae bacterium]|nr:helix-turn-helix domain-containing protein [Solirubrobacteraceae bacterium]
MSFNAEKRDRFLQLLDEGHTVAQACVAVGVSRTTINRWDRLGIEGANPDAIEFSQRYGAGREQRAGAQHRAGSGNRFTREKRTAFVILIAAGRTLAQACDDVGVSSVTVQTWDARGQAEHDDETTEFAALYAAALEARPAPEPDPQLAIAEPDPDAMTITPANAVTAHGPPLGIRPQPPRAPLSEERLIELLERQAQRGVVGAIKLLLERPWERRADEDDTPAQPSDPFDDAPIDIADERQRRRA